MIHEGVFGTLRVKPSVSPQGVEHMTKYGGGTAAYFVKPSVSPQGVEHIAGMAPRKPGRPREAISVAARR